MSLVRPRFALTAVLGLALAALAAPAARAQSLQELYEAARGYDATYLAARALADSAQYRAEQVEALRRPSASLSSNLTRTETDLPIAGSSIRGSTGLGVSVTGRQPLFNRANDATVEQARKALDVSRYDLSTAEQDLIVRVAQAYFDVLAAQDALITTRTAKSAIAEQLASACPTIPKLRGNYSRKPATQRAWAFAPSNIFSRPSRAAAARFTPKSASNFSRCGNANSASRSSCARWRSRFISRPSARSTTM